MFGNVPPNVLFSPGDERVYLHNVKFCVPLYDFRISSFWRLLPPYGGDPCINVGERGLEWFYLSDVATLVGFSFPEFVAMFLGLSLDSQVRCNRPDGDAIP